MGEKEVRGCPRTEWSTEYSIAFLPPDIRDQFRECADYLFHDLNDNRLEVILVPAEKPRHPGHMVRMAVSQNPLWYQELYRTYSAQLRRPHSLRALNRIRHVRGPQLYPRPRGVVERYYAYVTYYREVILNMLVTGYESGSLYIPPSSRIQDFFGIDGRVAAVETHFPREVRRAVANF